MHRDYKMPNAYDAFRVAQMMANQWYMVALGLEDASAALGKNKESKQQTQSKNTKNKRASPRPHTRRSKRRKATADDDEPEALVRNSSSSSSSESEEEGGEKEEEDEDDEESYLSCKGTPSAGSFDEMKHFEERDPKSWTKMWKTVPLPPSVPQKDFLKILDDLGHDHTQFPADYYCFVLRVVKAYHTSNKNNQHHFNRHEQCTEAIVEVFNTIPATGRPHDGNAETASKVVLPMLEMLFDMPKGQSVPGTAEWLLQAKVMTNALTIEQLVTMDEPSHSLKKAWIRQQKRQNATDTSGYPVRNFKVPSATTNYKKTVPARVAKRQTRKYGKIHYLRSASHQYAIQALKRDNVYPIVCAPDKHPQGMCTSCFRTGDACFRTGVL